MTHPLTDEKVSDLIQPICEWAYEASRSGYDETKAGYTEFDMEADRAAITDEIEIATKIVRDAYDLGRNKQLEQVIEWLKINTGDYVCEEYYGTYFLTEDFLDDLKKAMRPTTTQEINS